LVVSSIPILLELLHDPDWVFRPIFRGISACGNAAVPLMLIGLGASLATTSPTTASLDLVATASPKRPLSSVSYIVAMRNCVLPFFVITVVLVSRHWTSLGNDPTFLLTILILGTTPPAINLSLLSQATGKFEAETAQLLYMSYVVAIPAIALQVTFYLWLIKVYGH